MSENFLVLYILKNLLTKYGPFKIFYDTHKNIWSINELMAMYVQEEGRLVIETRESAFMTSQGKKTNQANNRSKRKATPETNIKKEVKCRFYTKKGHIRQDYVRFQQ